MGKKRESLNYQLHKKLMGLLRIGESRDLAKKEYKQYCLENNIKYVNGQAVGIFSWNTYNAYKQTLEEFTKWLSGTEYHIRFADEITRDIAIEYLQYRRDLGLSAWSLDKDKSALNKVFNFGITKKEAELPIRRVVDITRSRLSVKQDKHVNLDNYYYQVLFARASGARRESILKVRKGDFIFENGLCVLVYLKEKGGRERYAPILEEYQEELTRYINSIPSGVLFTKYSKNIDNHSFRAEYAQKLYNQFLKGGVPDYVTKYTL